MNSNHTEHDLNARLSRQAEQFDRLGGSDLDLGQVLDRAGEIRRGRRMRATIVMAACVLAIAVPTALVSIDRGGDKEPQPAPPSQVDRSALTLDGLEQGDAPHIAYVQSGALHREGFTYTSKGERYVGAAELRNGTMLAVRDKDGNLTARALDGDSWPMSGDFAASQGGEMVAFVQPDGTPVVVTSDGTRSARKSYTLPRIQRGSGFDAVAVDGQGCRTTVEFPCRVWVTSHGSSPESWTSTSGDIARKTRPQLGRVTDVDSTETEAASVVEVREDLTSCSAVVHIVDRTQRWATCDYRLLEFSPDDKRLLATGSVGDGIGDTQLAVLDTQSGKVELDLRTADQVFIGQMVWEDDSHVLATVFQGGMWAVLRIGLDGRRQYAVAPVQAEDIDSPFALATR
jgi:hypothetical protein